MRKHLFLKSYENQHDDTQHNSIKHVNKYLKISITTLNILCRSALFCKLSVVFYIVVLNVVMLSVLSTSVSSAMTLCATTLSIMTLRTTILIIAIKQAKHTAKQHLVLLLQCHYAIIIILSVVMLTVTMLNVVMTSGIMLSISTSH